MSEKNIILDPTIALEILGANNANISRLINAFPKLKIITRGNELKLFGVDNELNEFEDKLNKMLAHFEKFGKLSRHDVELMVTDFDFERFSREAAKESDASIIVHGNHGKVIKAITINQQRLVDSVQNHDMIFAVGPAGTGKTYTAVALAVRALKNKEIRRIILTRPAVEAGENLGFLPGDLRDKLDPYLQPLYDALRDMIPQQKLVAYLEDKTIEIAPLAFMRGRTLDNAYVILDEAQNATEGQLKMFLTRMGMNAKFFITGDVTQVDLPRHQNSGLIQAMKILGNITNIDFIMLDNRDVVRHQLVTKIIEAYEKSDDEKLERKNKNNLQ
ncbi:MAG: PhoH family protein [Bacteroidota bacterium]